MQDARFQIFFGLKIFYHLIIVHFTYSWANVPKVVYTIWKWWFWLGRRKTSWAAKKVIRWRNDSITWWKLLPNTRRARRIFGSDSSSHLKTFKSSRIHSKARKLGSTWTQAERRWKTVLHVRNATGTPQKEVIFATDCYWWWKMDPLRQPQAQKVICETQPTSQINGKAEYP